MPVGEKVGEDTSKVFKREEEGEEEEEEGGEEGKCLKGEGREGDSDVE